MSCNAEAGVSLDALVNAIPNLRLPSGRYEEISIPGKPRIIYDAYNANASGTMAALDAFAEEAGARRIAVLSSMAELGEEAEALHVQERSREGGAPAERTETFEGPDESWKLEWDEFVRAIAHGSPYSGGPADGLLAMTMLDAPHHHGTRP